MSRFLVLLGPVADAAISGASWLVGDQQLGLFAFTSASICSAMLLSIIRIAADALELPDVMPLELN